MRLASFNHIRLLRYAGLFTYVCVGIPLLWDSVRAPEDAGDPVDRAWWMSSYLVFGLAYWLVTRHLGGRNPWQLKIPLLLTMNASAVAINYFSHSGLSGILMGVIAGVLPWLMPFWPGLVWVVVQNFSLAPTTAMSGNVCGRTKVGTVIASRWIGVDAFNHFLSNERVASHERSPRQIASATPIAEIAARAPSFRLTISLVPYGSYLR